MKNTINLITTRIHQKYLIINIETSILHNNLIVHIYVDVSVIEIFLNYKKVITSRIYPNSNSKFLEIYSEGGNAEVDVKLWSIKDIGNVSV